MRIVIVGLGEIGESLAKNLMETEQNELVLVEIDEERCERVSEDIDAVVICGDGSHPDILQKAQLEKADALVACTGSDPINTVIAILGRDFGVENILVTLKSLGLRAACQRIGVRRIVAPKVAAVGELIASIQGSEKVDLSVLQQSGLQCAEIEVGKAADKAIRDLDIPEGTLPLAIIADERARLARPNTELRRGDVLMVIVESQDALRKTEKIVGPED